MLIKVHKALSACIAIIWLANGLFCKVLNFVPRHEQIVARIMGVDKARPLTVIIGISETLMAVWILTGIKSKLNVIVQIIVVAAMNTLEFFLAPNLLLWGKFNALFAFILIIVVYYNEFNLNKRNL